MFKNIILVDMETLTMTWLPQDLSCLDMNCSAKQKQKYKLNTLLTLIHWIITDAYPIIKRYKE